MNRTIKAFLSLLLVGTMFIGACGAFAAGAFVDVPDNAWYRESAYYCAAHNLMLGTADGTFSPKGDITRAMLVTVLYRLNGQPQVSEDCVFTDVNKGSYYYDAVKWANANGIAFGTTATTFAPNEPVTREQVACFVARYAKFVDAAFLNDPPAELAYTDLEQVSPYAKEAVDVVRFAALMLGDENNTFHPQKTMTRAEGSVLLMNLNRKLEGKHPAVLYTVAADGTKTERTLSEADTNLLRGILTDARWKQTPMPEYIATHEIVLDDTVYQFERGENGSYNGFRLQKVYGGAYDAYSVTDKTALAQLDAILFAK